MRVIKTVFLILVCILLYSCVVWAKTEKIISKKNEFGGKTVEITYFKEDDMENLLGIRKSVLYENSNRKIIKIETFYTGITDNYNRMIAYYDNHYHETKTEFYINDKLIKTETNRFISEKNEFGGKTVEKAYFDVEYRLTCKKNILYTDSNGKTIKNELFYTDKFADKEGYNKSIEYFDSHYKTTKTEFYLNERLVKTE